MRKKLRVRLASTSPKVTISEWYNTALEVCGDKHSEIYNIYQIYKELSETELNIDRLILYIEEIVNTIPTPEDRKRLISVEAFGERKFS